MDWLSFIIAGGCIAFFCYAVYMAMQEMFDKLWELIKRGLNALADNLQSKKEVGMELVYE